MCRRVSCADCGKATYAGCGAHVDQVLAGVPANERCRCETAAMREVNKGKESVFARLLRGLKA